MSEHANAAESHPSKKAPSVLGGAMIVAGTAIGAGMFALPVYSSGMWFVLSLILLVFCWYCAYSSGLYLAEASQYYPSGASYSTIAADTMGPLGQLAATVTVGFVSFILCYAYISGGGSVVSSAMTANGIDLSHSAAAVLFVLVFGIVVLAGTHMVERISLILLAGMVLSFFGSVSMMASGITTDKLISGAGLENLLPYCWVAVPVLVTSFGFHSTVPSLVKYYRQEMGQVRLAMLWGSLLALLIYGLWQLGIMGNVSRLQFVDVIAEGGNVASLIRAVGDSNERALTETLLMIFGNLALASSFVGVSLGLLDLVRDLLKLDDSMASTFKAGALTFLPPMLGAVVAPNGFITAIGYASLLAAVFVLVLPPLMAYFLRKRHGLPVQSFITAGGSLRLYMVVGFGALAVLCEALNLFNLLPRYS
ncbi:MAG: aromatic amino acid transport family protein [Ferrimonas sp.]